MIPSVGSIRTGRAGLSLGFSSHKGSDLLVHGRSYMLRRSCGRPTASVARTDLTAAHRLTHRFARCVVAPDRYLSIRSSGCLSNLLTRTVAKTLTSEEIFFRDAGLSRWAGDRSPRRKSDAILGKARIVHAAALGERDRGRNLDSSKQTLNQYLDRWLDLCAKPRLRAKSFVDYQGLLRRYVRPCLGANTLATVSAFDIQMLYRDLLTSGLSARS